MTRPSAVRIFFLAAAIPLLAAGVRAHEGPDGVFVDSVLPAGPAARAGLAAGDRIVSIDGKAIATIADLWPVLEAHAPGDRVPVVLERGGQAVEILLTFGERTGARVSLGVGLRFGDDPGAESTPGTVACLAWIEQTYRIGAVTRDLGRDLAAARDDILACVRRDTQRMPADHAIKYCDNVFKVHCPGVDLLSRIAEFQVERCEDDLERSLGLAPRRHRAWTTCGQHRVFDRYAVSGEATDERGCRDALLVTCGASLDTAAAARELSAPQRAFAACCSAASLAASDLAAGGRCDMLDDGFTRGPCRDRSACVNRQTGEWLSCAASE